MTTDEPFVVDVRVRNGPLLRAILAEYRNIAQFCKAIGINQCTVGELLNLKKSPLNERGEWLPSVLKLSEFLGPLPEELFPDVTHVSMESNVRRLWVSEEQARLLATQPLAHLTNIEDGEAVWGLVKQAQLTPRQERILEMRFKEDQSDVQIAEAFGVTKARIAQIEAQALRRVRVVDELRKYRAKKTASE